MSAQENAKRAKEIMSDRPFRMALQAALPSFGVSLFAWLHWHYLCEHMVGMKSKCMFGDTKLAELGILVGVYILLILVVAAIIALLTAVVQIVANPAEMANILGQAVLNKITGK